MGILESIRNALGINAVTQEELGILEPPEVVSWNQERDGTDGMIRIRYRGLLKTAGANAVYLHYAFDNWNFPARTVKMEHLVNGDFEVKVQPEGKREINFCFKDSADNWDNNNGWNWTVNL
ncbi:MAG TPA: carbohydrate-binding protein [Bacillota bacterium]